MLVRTIPLPWQIISLCAMWKLWCERSMSTFGGVEQSNFVIKEFLLRFLVYD